MKKTLYIISFALAAAMLLAYCRSSAPATSPVPESVAPKPQPVQVAQNIAVGQWSITAVYPGDIEFHILFSDSVRVGRAMYRAASRECWYVAEETCRLDSTEWAATWGESYVRICTDGSTEAQIEGQHFVLR